MVKVNVEDGDASRPVIPEPLRGNGGVVQKTVASVKEARASHRKVRFSHRATGVFPNKP